MQARLGTVIAVILGIVMPVSGGAQTLETISVNGDWSTYRDSSGVASCFMVASPSASEASRDGNPVSVERGDIRFFITIMSDSPGVTEPSFRAGYSLTTAAPATVTISGSDIALYPNAEYCAQADAIDRCDQYAWTEPSDDAALISAMKAGATAQVTGQSRRGTITRDTFSLSGFTAALNDATQACAQ